MKHRIFILLAVILFINYQTGFSDPGNYYNEVDSSKSCATFKTILAARMSTGVISLSYGDVDFYYNRTDSKPSENGTGDVIIDRYSSERPTGLDSCNYVYDVSFCSSGGTAGSQCVCYVKEHVFPSSWFNNQFPMRSDLHLLLPADNYTNNYKSNYPLGHVQTASFTSYNGTKIGTSNSTLNFGFSSTHVFEPIDQFKGDFARIYLYMVTRYESFVSGWTTGTANDVMAGNTYPALDPWILQLCVKWHKQDPPDALERKRNDTVFAIQGNRNPYVDYPHWVEKVFGTDGIPSSCINTAVRYNRTVDFSVYPNPVNNGILFINLNTILKEEVQMEVTDVLGKKLIAQQLQPGAAPALDISSLPNGIYLLNLLYKDTNNTITFIKE